MWVGVLRCVPRPLQVANAVGAALGQVSGSVDRIVTLDSDNREASWKRAQRECEEAATLIAVAEGADPRTVNTVDVSDMDVPYVGKSGVAKRIRVRVVGDLQSSEQPLPTEGESQPKGGVAKVQQVSTAVVECDRVGRWSAVDYQCVLLLFGV